MRTHTLAVRQPVAALKRLVLAALLLGILTQAVALLLIGQADPEVVLGLGMLVVAAVLVTTSWRWAPALAAVLATIPIVGGLPYLLDHLAHPAAFGFFAAAVVNIVCAFAATIGGIGATVQQYRGSPYTPRWLATVSGGLVGLALGALLIGGFLAMQATQPRTTGTTDEPPIVHMGPLHSSVDRVTVPHGATLRLTSDGAFPHVIANGAWDGNTAKPGREPGAPLVADVQVSRDDQVVEIGPFAASGTFQFYCPLHPGMQLTAIVQ